MLVPVPWRKPSDPVTSANVLASVKCTTLELRKSGPLVTIEAPLGSSGCTSVTSLGPKPNVSDTRLSCPPVIDELTPVARLPAPPEMDAKLFGCPALSLQIARREGPPDPARFPQPPEIDE